MNLTALVVAAVLGYGPVDGGHAVTRGLIAWSEPSQLRAGAIDDRGVLRSSSTIAVPGGASHMTLAGDGDAFLLAFVQRSEFLGPVLGIVPLDAHGRPTAAVRILGPAADTPPQLVRNGETYVVWDLRTRYELDRRGAVVSQQPERPQFSVVAFDGGELRWTSSSIDAIRHCTYFPQPNCRWYPATYRVDWTFTGASVTVSGSGGGEWYSTASPAAAGDALNALLAWNGVEGIGGVLIRNGVQTRISVPGFTEVEKTPAIAFDGERFLVAFDVYGDIYAAFVDGPVGHRFPVATTGEHESTPRVTALGANRFLVTYERNGVLTGQVVGEIEPPARRRSVR